MNPNLPQGILDTSSMSPGVTKKDSAGGSVEPWPVSGMLSYPDLTWISHSTSQGDFRSLDRDAGHCRRLNSKRRMDKCEQGPVSKHFVTEEQMATRFTCLSLNNDHCYASTGFPAQPGHCHGLEPAEEKEYQHFVTVEERLEPKDYETEIEVETCTDMEVSPRLVFSSALTADRLNSLDTGLPRSSFYSLYPTGAELVLWKPPGNFIPEVIQSLRSRGFGGEQHPEEDSDRDPSKDTDGGRLSLAEKAVSEMELE
ncbi:uncharacterized protein LOC114661739 isoform X1 [Erpetoichthys calabaricus]|uniref:uncharacterized protein LOC114661739 isoform X1 n=1 Tax=Erpetoichthys calabaricus TaxID=27687 RepID=UPI00109F8801|nr:uncharacterized protein LOC114661739 isoform X1 [Erpetoichthys calabaricus]XP_028670749.1 uncharacterized protein LOC114661739 isoform X1 [Erpetoichthys calabaricus]